MDHGFVGPFKNMNIIDLPEEFRDRATLGQYTHPIDNLVVCFTMSNDRYDEF